MKKLIYIILFSLTTMVSSIYAQNINGNVSDAESGLPLVGVNISVEGLNKGAVTDFDGNFNLSGVEVDANLIFTYVGYKTLSRSIGEESNLIILMETDLSELDEVVVVGYGTQKLSDISGAVSTVSNEAIEASSPVSVEDALQGQASGINII